MKKGFIGTILLLAALSLSVLAGCGAKSSATDLTLHSVCEVTVTDTSVQLTAAQWEQLRGAEDPLSLLSFDVHEKASATASLSGQTLTITVTAEDGTTKDYTYTVTILSGDTTFALTSVSGVNVAEGGIALTNAQWTALQSAENPLDEAEYTLAEKSSVALIIEGQTLKFTVTAEDGTKKDYTYTVTVLSSDTTFALTSVSGVNVAEGGVALTNAQWTALQNAQTPIDEAEYTLAEKASVALVIEGQTLKFTVTAEDGTKKDHTYTVRVKSSDTTYTVTLMDKAPEADGSFLLTEQEYADYHAETLETALNVTLTSAAARYEASVDANHTITVKVTAEDGTTAENSYPVQVVKPFGALSRTNYASASNASYDYENATGFVVNGATAILGTNGLPLSNTYSFSMEISFVGLKKDAEIVLMSYETGNTMIRYLLRGLSETQFTLYTDYRDRGGFRNLTPIVSNIPFTEGEFYSFTLYHSGNEAALAYEGETVYRRALPSMAHSEACISTVSCSAIVRNITTEHNAAQAQAAFESALIGYTDTLIGTTLINSGDRIEQIVQNEDGSLELNNPTSNGRIMAALYDKGVPVGGYEYAVTGSVRVYDTKTTGGSASKLEFQIYQSMQNFIKFHLFRYPTNNSFHAYPTENSIALTIVRALNNMTQGTDYTFDYAFVYDNGRIEVWWKDSAYTTFTKIYTYETNWGYTGYAFASRQYCCSTWTNTTVHYGEDFDALMQTLNGTTSPFATSDSATELTQESAFEAGQNGTFYKKGREEASAWLYHDGALVQGESWMLDGTISLYNCKNWSQGVLEMRADDTHALRFVHEYDEATSSYQVFTEHQNGDSAWSGYRRILAPRTANPASLNFTIVNNAGTCSFLMDGFVYYTADFTLTNPAVKLGGKDSTVKVSCLVLETDAAVISEFAQNMKEPTYVSPFESRIQALAKEYEGAQTGGILLAGSSTIDFWDTYQEDLGADTLTYNVGIGGTIVEDWLYAYDRLVKPFAPSQIVLFLGGNNINTQGHTGAETCEMLAQLLEKMHADFPSARIHYVLSLPVPNNFSNGEYTLEYGRLIECMKAYGVENDWLNIIDLEKPLTTTDGMNAVPDYFKPDGIHLTAAGYSVWTQHIRAALGLDA